METSQSGHENTWPQPLHDTKVEYPRLLMNNIACSPRSKHSLSELYKEVENKLLLPYKNSLRMSTTSTLGIGMPLILSGISKGVSLPRIALK